MKIRFDFMVAENVSSRTQAIARARQFNLLPPTLSGRKIPFITSDRAALIALVVIGMAMCSRGIGRVAALGQWTHPLAVLGYLVGGLILVIAVAALASKPLPMVQTVRQAILAVSLLSAAKIIITSLHRFLL